MNTEKYKTLLLTRLDEVLSQLGGIAEQDIKNPDDWRAKIHDESVNEADPLEVADKIESLMSDNAITEELEAQLNDIKRALKKIDDGTYGIDEVDGEPIPEERLEVNPAARTKVENADKLSS